MKELRKERRAKEILNDPTAKDSFVLDNLLVRDARREQHQRERGKKKKQKKDCGLVAFPSALAEQRQKDFFFLTWTVWFRLVSKLEEGLKKDPRYKQHQAKREIIFSLSYEQKKTFPPKFDRWGFVFKIHQLWVAEILKKEFGLLEEMAFPHPCPLQMYEDIICGHDLIPKLKP